MCAYQNNGTSCEWQWGLPSKVPRVKMINEAGPLIITVQVPPAQYILVEQKKHPTVCAHVVCKYSQQTLSVSLEAVQRFG